MEFAKGNKKHTNLIDIYFIFSATFWTCVFSPFLRLNVETQRNRYYNKRSSTHDNDNIRFHDTKIKVN